MADNPTTMGRAVNGVRPRGFTSAGLSVVLRVHLPVLWRGVNFHPLVVFFEKDRIGTGKFCQGHAVIPALKLFHGAYSGIEAGFARRFWPRLPHRGTPVVASSCRRTIQACRVNGVMNGHFCRPLIPGFPKYQEIDLRPRGAEFPTCGLRLGSHFASVDYRT